MNSAYVYNNKLPVKNNILVYLKSNPSAWISVKDINIALNYLEHKSIPSQISIAYSEKLLDRTTINDLYKYKINQNGLKYLDKISINSTETPISKQESLKLDIFGALKNGERTVRWIHKFLNKKHSKRTIVGCLEHLVNNKIVKRNDDYDKYSPKPATYSLISCDNSNNKICDNKTSGYQKKIDQKDIINYLNASNSWTDPATVANVLGFNPRTHAGTIGHILSTMYEDGTILRKIEKAGARFYAHIDYVDDLDRVLSNELIETKDTDTIDTTKTYSVLLRERTKYLLGEGGDLDDLGKICFEALQPEYDQIKERKHQEFIENKRTEQMKYLEDNKFIVLDDNKKLQDRILDLEDKLNKIESKEMYGRAMAEHVVKNEIIK